MASDTSGPDRNHFSEASPRFTRDSSRRLYGSQSMEKLSSLGSDKKPFLIYSTGSGSFIRQQQAAFLRSLSISGSQTSLNSLRSSLRSPTKTSLDDPNNNITNNVDSDSSSTTSSGGVKRARSMNLPRIPSKTLKDLDSLRLHRSESGENSASARMRRPGSRFSWSPAPSYELTELGLPPPLENGGYVSDGKTRRQKPSSVDQLVKTERENGGYVSDGKTRRQKPSPANQPVKTERENGGYVGDGKTRRQETSSTNQPVKTERVHHDELSACQPGGADRTRPSSMQADMIVARDTSASVLSRPNRPTPLSESSHLNTAMGDSVPYMAGPPTNTSKSHGALFDKDSTALDFAPPSRNSDRSSAMNSSRLSLASSERLSSKSRPFSFHSETTVSPLLPQEGDTGDSHRANFTQRHNSHQSDKKSGTNRRQSTDSKRRGMPADAARANATQTSVATSSMPPTSHPRPDQRSSARGRTPEGAQSTSKSTEVVLDYLDSTLTAFSQADHSDCRSSRPQHTSPQLHPQPPEPPVTSRQALPSNKTSTPAQQKRSYDTDLNVTELYPSSKRAKARNTHMTDESVTDPEAGRAEHRKKKSKSKHPSLRVTKYEGNVKTVRRQIKPGHVEELKEIFKRQEDEEERLVLRRKRRRQGDADVDNSTEDADDSGSGYSSTSDNEYDLVEAERKNFPDYFTAKSSAPVAHSPQKEDEAGQSETKRSSYHASLSEASPSLSHRQDPETSAEDISASQQRFAEADAPLSPQAKGKTRYSPFLSRSVQSPPQLSLPPAPAAADIDTFTPHTSSSPGMHLPDNKSSRQLQSEGGRSGAEGTGVLTTSTNLASSTDVSKTSSSSPDTNTKVGNEYSSEDAPTALTSMADPNRTSQFEAPQDTSSTCHDLTDVTTGPLHGRWIVVSAREDTDYTRQEPSPLHDKQALGLIDGDHARGRNSLPFQATGEEEEVMGVDGEGGRDSRGESGAPGIIVCPDNRHSADEGTGSKGGGEGPVNLDKSEADTVRVATAVPVDASRPEESDVYFSTRQGKLATSAPSHAQETFAFELAQETTELIADTSTSAAVSSVQNSEAETGGHGPDDFFSILNNIQLNKEASFSAETAVRARQLYTNDFTGSARNSAEIAPSDTDDSTNQAAKERTEDVNSEATYSPEQSVVRTENNGETQSVAVTTEASFTATPDELSLESSVVADSSHAVSSGPEITGSVKHDDLNMAAAVQQLSTFTDQQAQESSEPVMPVLSSSALPPSSQSADQKADDEDANQRRDSEKSSSKETSPIPPYATMITVTNPAKPSSHHSLSATHGSFVERLAPDAELEVKEQGYQSFTGPIASIEPLREETSLSLEDEQVREESTDAVADDQSPAVQSLEDDSCKLYRIVGEPQTQSFKPADDMLESDLNGDVKFVTYIHHNSGCSKVKSEVPHLPPEVNETEVRLSEQRQRSTETDHSQHSVESAVSLDGRTDEPGSQREDLRHTVLPVTSVAPDKSSSTTSTSAHVQEVPLSPMRAPSPSTSSVDNSVSSFSTFVLPSLSRNTDPARDTEARAEEGAHDSQARDDTGSHAKEATSRDHLGPTASLEKDQSVYTSSTSLNMSFSESPTPEQDRWKTYRRPSLIHLRQDSQSSVTTDDGGGEGTQYRVMTDLVSASDALSEPAVTSQDTDRALGTLSRGHAESKGSVQPEVPHGRRKWSSKQLVLDVSLTSGLAGQDRPTSVSDPQPALQGDSSFGDNDSQYGSQTSKATSVGDVSPTSEHLYRIVQPGTHLSSPTSPILSPDAPLRLRHSHTAENYRQQRLNRSQEAGGFGQSSGGSGVLGGWRLGRFSHSDPDLAGSLFSSSLSTQLRGESGTEDKRYRVVRTDREEHFRSSSSDSDEDSGVEGGKRLRLKSASKQRSNSVGSLGNAPLSLSLPLSPSRPPPRDYRVSSLQRQSSWEQRQEAKYDVGDNVYRVTSVTRSEDEPGQVVRGKLGHRGENGEDFNSRSWSAFHSGGDETSDDDRSFRVLRTEAGRDLSVTDDLHFTGARIRSEQVAPSRQSQVLPFDAGLSHRPADVSPPHTPHRPATGTLYCSVVKLDVNQHQQPVDARPSHAEHEHDAVDDADPSTDSQSGTVLGADSVASLHSRGSSESDEAQYKVSNVKASPDEQSPRSSKTFDVFDSFSPHNRSFTETDGESFRVVTVKSSEAGSRRRGSRTNSVSSDHSSVSLPTLSTASGYDSGMEGRPGSMSFAADTPSVRHHRPLSATFDNSPSFPNTTHYVVNSPRPHSQRSPQPAFHEEERVTLREIKPRVFSPPPQPGYRSPTEEWRRTNIVDSNRNFGRDPHDGANIVSPLLQQQSRRHGVFNSVDNVRDFRQDVTSVRSSLQRSGSHSFLPSERQNRVKSPTPTTSTSFMPDSHSSFRSAGLGFTPTRTETFPNDFRSTTTHSLYPDNVNNNDDGQTVLRREIYEEKTFEMRQETTHVAPELDPEETEKDLRVLRGNILIRNRLDDSRDQDDFLDNMNIFDTSFHLGKDNPLYQSDPDIYKTLEAQLQEEEERSRSIEQEVTQDVTFETVDRVAREHKAKATAQTSSSGGSRSNPRAKQNLSTLLLSKLAAIDSKDIHQTIDVQHRHQDIYGDVHLVHADGSSSSTSNTNNFDSVYETIELVLKQGKAVVIIKVIAERIAPIDLEFNVWRKTQAIVTRNIEVDLHATEQRRRLYRHVMETGGRLHHHDHPHHDDDGWGGLGGEYTRYASQLDDLGAATLRSSRRPGEAEDERQLTSLETLRLFSQILDVAGQEGARGREAGEGGARGRGEGEGGARVRAAQEPVSPASAMDLLF